MNSFSELTVVAIQAALKAGDIVRKGFGTHYGITSKAGKQNFATDYDHASEECIIDLITSTFPDHSILAEESGSAEKDSSITWIIDPIDGTTNFLHQIPLFVISIAAYNSEGPLCGVIYQPITQELFTAEQGKGAYLNGQRIKVSHTSIFAESLIGVGFPYEGLEENSVKSLDHMTYFAKQGLTLRNLGSAALNLAYVAAGKFDGMVLNLLYPWDAAAGMLLVQEAGGLVTNYEGAPLNIFKPTSIIATNGLLHDEILSHIHH